MKPGQPILTIFLVCLIYVLGCKSSNTADPVIKNKGVLIDYTDTHTGDTTLLFVHGWCLNKTYWDDQAAYFKDRYRVIAIDLPGFGKSGKNQKSWNSKAFGDDVAAVINQLHLKNVILVGHSMAGDIILQAAKNDPKQVIGLVGVDNFKSVGTGSKPTKADTVAYNQVIGSLRSDFKKVANDYFNEQLFYTTTPPQIKTRILIDVARTDPNIAASCMEMDDFDEAKEIKSLGQKLFLINSDYTPTDTTGLHLNKIPFQIWYIHATGHFPMVEKPKEFNQALARAIARINN